jgi:hypothetical protein
MKLVASYYLLVPPWRRQEFIDRFNGTGRVPGFERVRSSLLDIYSLSLLAEKLVLMLKHFS